MTDEAESSSDIPRPPDSGVPQQPPAAMAYPTPQPAVPGTPKNDQANTAMVFGIIAVAGGMFCCLPYVLAPVAWVLGQRALNETRRNPQLGGHGEAMAGLVLGIIGTVLMVLAIISAVFILTLVIAAPAFFADY